MFQDFKKFVMRGNVLDMAVGIIIGGAFGKIVSSFVNDVIMPPIGMLLGGVDFSDLYVNLSGGSYPSLAAARDAGAAVIAYGQFANVVLDFLIVAFSIFLVIRATEMLRTKQEQPRASVRPCPECLAEIPLAARRCRYCTAVIAS